MKWRGGGGIREILEKTPPTSGIVRCDSHVAKFGSDPAGNRTRVGENTEMKQVTRTGNFNAHVMKMSSLVSNAVRQSSPGKSTSQPADQSEGNLPKHGQTVNFFRDKPPFLPIRHKARTLVLSSQSENWYAHIKGIGTPFRFCIHRYFWGRGGLVVNHVRFPAGSPPNFHMCGNRAGRCHWSVDYLGDLPFPKPLHSGAAPYSPHFTLIGSQDSDAKSHPNLFTHFSLCHTGNIDIKHVYTEVDCNWIAVYKTRRARLCVNSRLAEKQVASAILPAHCVIFCLVLLDWHPELQREENVFKEMFSGNESRTCEHIAVALSRPKTSQSWFQPPKPHHDIEAPLPPPILRSLAARGGHGSVVVRLLASHIGEPAFDSRRSHSRISACRNRAGRCRWSTGFLGDYPFTPRPCIPALLQTHLAAPS
ncbi:hypothetical protein PR048_002881 [Dryococelus australis]|uniref:Uncharacterized protein n=1 Tax=Dryococelus australis TaxID=614101 RepID=A0ABQ9IMU9_9NEOP|nr:hypothetical protein PR048_002881 [Dryococelus australis]